MRSPDDPGLARERTALAWQRTTVAFGGVAILLLVHALRGSAPLAALAGVPLAAALFAHRHGRASYRARLRGDHAPPRAALWTMAVATVACAVAAALSAALR